MSAAPSDWLAWIETRRVTVQPVMGREGVVFWTAAFVTLSTDGYTNVQNTSAVGETAVDALSNLRAGVVQRKNGKQIGPHVLCREDMLAALGREPTKAKR